MTAGEKIALLEDMLELDKGALTLDTVLDDLADWDSMSALSLIVLMDENFQKKLTGAQIRKFVTVKDVIDYME